MTETIVKEEERIAFALRSLYRKYGYLPYKMSKFEAYDLYVANKDFLVGDGVITFNDTDGKLLALKPDVTLSIIKNTADEDGAKKVYYHENVYRISGETKQFKEIPQVGLERIGEITAYDVFETVKLAAESLAVISPNYVLDISHIGILAATLNELQKDKAFNREIMRLVAEKNMHEMRALCKSYDVEDAKTEKLLTLVSAYGDMQKTLTALAPLCESEEAKKAYDELKTLCDLLISCGYENKIRVDFSVVNDMKYYNGIVFKGFVDGVCEGVLAGGQYDSLMSRMGRKAGAIGFAVYLDLLEDFKKSEATFDIDTLVLYDEKTSLQTLTETVEKLVQAGKSVRALKGSCGIRFNEVLDLRQGGTK